MEYLHVSDSEVAPRALQRSAVENMERFLCLYLHHPTVHPGNKGIELGVDFTEEQMQVARNVFSEYNVDAPDAIHVGQLSPSPWDKKQDGNVLSFIEVAYPETVVMYGGILKYHQLRKKGIEVYERPQTLQADIKLAGEHEQKISRFLLALGRRPSWRRRITKIEATLLSTITDTARYQ